MSAPLEERHARVVLAQTGEPGSPSLTAAVTDDGAAATLADLLALPGLDPDLRSRLAAADPAAELARARAQGLRFVVPGDDEWPVALDDLARVAPLHRRGGVPLGLWCRGPARLDEVATRAVAVVGSRSATSYGTQVAGGIAATCAREGWAVVSGAAFGIDQAAHRGALVEQAVTVAVLACGADRVYPLAHRDLVEHVARTGLVVSEAAPGWAPTRIRFLSRNRLIAALTGGVVGVEAAVRSGALNTASWAAGLGRLVMGVPGPVTSAPSAGVHQLIRARDALLVTSGDDVLEAISPMGEHMVAEPREADGPRDRLDATTRQVLDAVPKVRAVSAASIARTAAIPRAEVERSLATAHAAGLVEQWQGSWRLTGDEPLDVLGGTEADGGPG